MPLFIFTRSQTGFWGSTALNEVKVKAEDEAAAWAKMRTRKDFGKCLRNGDRISYSLLNQ